MNVQPVKKYQTPSYHTLAQTKGKKLCKDNTFSKRQKMLIAAASIVLCGTLSGCIPTRTDGTLPPPSTTSLPDGTPSLKLTPSRTNGALPSQQFTSEHDTYDALRNTANNNAAIQYDVSRTIHNENAQAIILPHDLDYSWNEEKDIQAAFNEFLDWMRAEGVV